MNYFRLSIPSFPPADPHTQRFGFTLSFRRFHPSFYESYSMGGASTSTLLMNQLVQEVIPPQHGAFEETSPRAGLSSIHSLILGRV